MTTPCCSQRIASTVGRLRARLPPRARAVRCGVRTRAARTSAVLNVAHWTLRRACSTSCTARISAIRSRCTRCFEQTCIDGVDVRESDRFDFDFEIVAKLVRRGYRPIEIPITYNSRGFDKGKKVRPIRDPLTWIVALVRFRFSSIPDRVTVQESKRCRTGRSPRLAQRVARFHRRESVVAEPGDSAPTVPCDMRIERYRDKRWIGAVSSPGRRRTGTK